MRRGDTKLDAKLAARELGEPALAALRAYVMTGAEGEELVEIGLELRAAITFVRSRAASSPSEKSESLVRAKAFDVWRGPITAAILGWPS